MHQLVSLVPVRTAHDAVPAQLGAVEFHALQTTMEGNNN